MKIIVKSLIMILCLFLGMAVNAESIVSDTCPQCQMHIKKEEQTELKNKITPHKQLSNPVFILVQTLKIGLCYVLFHYGFYEIISIPLACKDEFQTFSTRRIPWRTTVNALLGCAAVCESFLLLKEVITDLKIAYQKPPNNITD